MSTAEWMTLVGMLAAFAIGYGALQAKVAALREIIVELKSGRERTGERLHRIENEMSVLKALLAPRFPTLAQGVPQLAAPEESEERRR